MKICFLSRLNPYNYKSWSGTSYHMFMSLASYHEVTWIGDRHMSVLLRIIIKLHIHVERLLGIRRGYPYFNKWHSLLKGRDLNKSVNRQNFDVIISPNSPDQIAYLSTPVPIIYFRDTTFQLFVNYYPTFFDLSSSAIKEGNEIERNAINNSSRVIYSSHWAADSAIQFYGIKKEKVSIISFGANLMFNNPTRDDLCKDRDGGFCTLLFVGLDWHRKGGEIAYKTFLKLREDGVSCKLVIVGCNPKLEKDDDVEVVPYLDKNSRRDLDRLLNIYSKSHFVVLPSIADCTPIVFSEAAAFGIPVLTTDTGGNSSIIKDGVNGFLFPPGTDEQPYANKIKSILEDRPLYLKLKESCRDEFETKLSWDAWISRVNEIINQVVINKNSNFENKESPTSYANVEKSV